jgi:8-oxo-dGTP pyrophosphatase MutT (NUDIX family)
MPSPQTPRETPAPRTGRGSRGFGGRVGRLALLGAAAWGIALAVNRSLRRVEGPSMLPALWPDDLLVTVPPRLAGGIRPDDVVVADTPAGRVVKRVAGPPGQPVLITADHRHAAGRWHPHIARQHGTHRLNPGPHEVVLLGDNLGASTDSRTFGPVPVDAVVRVALARLRPWTWLRTHTPRPLPGPRERPTVRVVTLDPDDRVLLFEVADRDGTGDTWWETPGGGVEPDEDPAAAATRELAEELGHTDLSLVDLDVTVERDSSDTGAVTRKVERVLATRVPDDSVDTSGWTDAERREIVRWHWWTIEELRANGTAIHPAGLADLADRARDLLPR